jgi:hypothetical protein
MQMFADVLDARVRVQDGRQFLLMLLILIPPSYAGRLRFQKDQRFLAIDYDYEHDEEDYANPKRNQTRS